MNKTCLIFGGGSKFGAELVENLRNNDCRVYVVSSSENNSDDDFKIDWTTCDFMDVERLLKKIPKLDAVFFNQNFREIPETMDFNIPRPMMWKLGKNWMQAHFVNSIMPCQVLNTLIADKKFTNNSLAIWMLSGAVYKNISKSLIGYQSQKILNKEIVKSADVLNPGKYIGFDPGKISTENSQKKSKLLADFILKNATGDESFYQFDDEVNNIIPHKYIS